MNPTTILKLITIAILGTVSTQGAEKTARSSGNQSDVQNAINAAPNGGVVEIPNGTFTWTGQLTINKPVHLRGQSKGGVTIVAHNCNVDTISVAEAGSGNIEISNLNFDFLKAGDQWVYAIRTGPSNPRGSGRILLHDCNFKTNYAYAIEWDTNGGVIYNCVFDGTNSGGLTGLSFVPRSLSSDWTRVSTLGTLDTDGLTNTYVEDCQFLKTIIGCHNFDDNSRVVCRHNVYDNSQIGSHGQETSTYGARQWEIYDNQFICDHENKFNLNTFIQLRGGTGVITDNHFDDIPWGKVEVQLCVFNIRRRGQIPCQTQYPAARQIGQGWKGDGGYGYPSVPQDGTGYFTDPLAIWNNSGTCQVALNEYNPDECGNNQQIANYVHEGRDYLLSAKAGYQKYPYPHPLRTGGGGGGGVPTPTPVPSATPTPEPTATPTPTPTPQPTPSPSGQSYRQWLDELGQWIEQHPAHPDNK